ncbi:MAG: hypothetical protein HY231_23945 [Acidobacteria bacterium]|nr:hypothetical protein [Acidobacteriota bacterium]
MATIHAGQKVTVNVHFTDNYGNEVQPVGAVVWSSSDDLAIRVTPNPDVPTAAEVRSLGKAGTFGITATNGAVSVQATVEVLTNQLAGGFIDFGTPSEA